ncbi:hypothetical protein VCHC17A1_3138B, partial [Vibrio cholerae HC-17A1]
SLVSLHFQLSRANIALINNTLLVGACYET